MISGLSSSGIATAIRTAGKARATMDTMARQIATGQKVASVKDDGAAWTRAQSIKDSAATWEWRTSELRRLEATGNLIDFQASEGLTILREAVGVLRRAAQTQPSTEARAQLKNEYDVLLSRWRDLNQARLQVDSLWGLGSAGVPTTSAPYAGVDWSIDFTDADPYLNSLAMPHFWIAGGNAFGVNIAGYTPTVVTIEAGFNTVSAATMLAGANELDTSSGYSINRLQAHASRISGAMKQVELGLALSERAAARETAAAGAITDADLGKASAARAQAETRQQLALSTVRQAISTYGNYASGLLGNAQRSQRGIIA